MLNVQQRVDLHRLAKGAGALLLVAALGLSGAALAEPGNMKVTVRKAEGSVQVTKAGQWIKAEEGMTLLPGSKVKTGPEGEAVLSWDNGNVLKLKPLTNMTIKTLTKDGDTTKASLTVKSGSVFAKVKELKTAESSFVVGTPTAVAGVRGTAFNVSVDGKGARQGYLDQGDAYGRAFGGDTFASGEGVALGRDFAMAPVGSNSSVLLDGPDGLNRVVAGPMYAEVGDDAAADDSAPPATDDTAAPDDTTGTDDVGGDTDPPETEIAVVEGEVAAGEMPEGTDIDEVDPGETFEEVDEFEEVGAGEMLDITDDGIGDIEEIPEDDLAGLEEDNSETQEVADAGGDDTELTNEKEEEVKDDGAGPQTGGQQQGGQKQPSEEEKKEEGGVEGGGSGGQQGSGGQEGGGEGDGGDGGDDGGEPVGDDGGGDASFDDGGGDFDDDVTGAVDDVNDINDTIDVIEDIEDLLDESTGALEIIIE